VQPGDTIDTVAKSMFSDGPHRTMAASNKRALLIHNNPYLENHLETNRLPMNMLLNTTPVMSSEMDKKHWNMQQTPLKMALNQMEKPLREMFHEVGPQPMYAMAQIVERLKSMDKKDAIAAAGYGVAGVSGYAATGEIAVSKINHLMRELYNEAVKKFGKKAVHKVNARNFKQMEQFLKSHPKYLELTKQLKELPKMLLPKGGYSTIIPSATYPRAGFFHKHVSLPLKKWHNPSLYVGRMAKQLNKRVQMFKGIGKGATWYVPALLGVASVATAPPEQKWRTAFEEGFGVLGGAFGTHLGGLAGVGIVAVLGLGPVGLFIAIFVCASAGGIIGMNSFKKFGSGIYDLGSQFGNGQIYHSPEQLLIGNFK
jgi:hypothetical protein